MAKQVSLSLDVPTKEIRALIKANNRLGEADLPYLKPAMGGALSDLAGAVGQRAPASFKVAEKGVSVTAAGIKAKGAVTHPGARSREFGRTTYYAGYTGRRMKSGHKVKRAGQKAQPFLGVKGGGAISATAPKSRTRILAAVAKEWERLASG